MPTRSQRRFSRYRNRWYQPGTGPELRWRYNDNLVAYLAAYKLRWTDAEIVEHQEEGIQDFVEVERRLLRRTQWRWFVDPFKAAGKLAFNAFLGALSTEDRSLTGETDFVLAAIDFEGDESLAGGVHGYGCAKLDTRYSLTRNPEADPRIDASNCRVARRNQGFLFGDTHRIDLEDLGEASQILLVGHGIEAHLRILRYLQINLAEDLPHIIGIVDTVDMARQYLGQFPSLRTLLAWLQIPFRRDLLHCAGNDAVFTMQALLAMAYPQPKMISSAWPALDLHRLAYRELDIAVREKNVERDWEDFLKGEGDCGIDLWE